LRALFLWTIDAHRPEALVVIDAWGILDVALP
jgi:hypothetical protein